MATVLFVNRFGYPDASATSQILSDLAFHLSARGNTVTILCSRLTYEGTEHRFAARESVRGVHIARVWTTSFGRASAIGRLIDYLTFYASAWIGTLKHVRRGDCVVVMTDPPMLSIALASAVTLRSAIIINWIQDLFPEVAQALGVRFVNGILGRTLKLARNRSLKGAALNVVIGSRMNDVMNSQNVPRVVEIPNWPIHDLIAPSADRVSKLRETWKLTGRFVVGYFGNLGRAHDYLTIVEAAGMLQGDSDVKFLIVGAGHHHSGLRDAICKRGLEKSFTFLPYQHRERLSEALAVADVHWLSLREALEGLVVPSKFYGILAAGRPIVAIGDPDGEIGKLVRESKCGFAIETGDAYSLAGAIRDLKSNTALREDMGNRSLSLLQRRFSAAHAYMRWEKLLATISPQRPSTGSVDHQAR